MSVAEYCADSPQVQAWMKELEGHDIPSFAPTVDGSCVNDTAAATDAANRGWWTCGGHTRATGKLVVVVAIIHV